jgi:hypothetical protein
MFMTRDHRYTECLAILTLIGMSSNSPSTYVEASLEGSLETSLNDLAHLIARDGIEAFESDIAQLVERLRTCRPVDRDRHEVLVQLLSDHSSPAVARERAFGALVGPLAESARRFSHREVKTAA